MTENEICAVIEAAVTPENASSMEPSVSINTDTLSEPPSVPQPHLSESLTINEEHFVHKPSRKSSSASDSNSPDSNNDPPPSITSSSVSDTSPLANEIPPPEGGVSTDARDEDPLMRELDRIASLSSPPKSLKTGQLNADGLVQKRRVKFPDDDKIVLGYMEPHYHWQNVPSCTTEELLTAYRQACAKNKVNPIPIVMEQLKGIDPQICNERYATLNLRGVKLTGRDIETLEQIFRRVQFCTLDFDNCNLDDETGSSLFDMIEYYESCTKLNISANPRIGARGLQSCSRMIKRTPCLETLIIRNTMFVDTSMPALGRALRIGCVNLRQLHLEHCNVCGRNLLILVSALKMNETLRELYLANNNLMPTDGIQLGALLKANRYLRLLDVRNNSLGDVGTCHLCDGLFEQSAPPPEAFNNPANVNAVEGVILLSNKEADTKLPGGLEVLLLGNNGITHVAMVAMAEALRRCAYLRTLSLGCNNLGGQGAHSLKEGLLCNRSLTRLQLPACKINCEGAVALAEFIADSKQLQRLDLRDNDIRTAGLMGLSHALRLNESVTRIDLDKEPKKEPQMKDYAQNQRFFLERLEESLRLNRDRAEKRNAEKERLALLVEEEEEPEANVDQVSLQFPEASSNSQPDVMDAQSRTESSDASSLDRPDNVAKSSEPSPGISDDTSASLPIHTSSERGDPSLSSRILSPTDELFSSDIESFFEKAYNGVSSTEAVVSTDDSLGSSLAITEEQLNAEIAALPLSQRLRKLRKQRHQVTRHATPSQEGQNGHENEDSSDSSFEESEIDVFANGFSEDDNFLSVQFNNSRGDHEEPDVGQASAEPSATGQQPSV